MHPVISWSAPDTAREHFHHDGFVVMEPQGLGIVDLPVM
jgi:hypothetical protein